MSTERESGAAATEFALLVTLLLPLLAWALFFFELGTARLKLREAARFLAWELTAMPLSDFQEARHEAAFEKARAQLLAELAAPSKRFTESLAPKDQLSLRFGPLRATLESQDAGLLDPLAARAHFSEPGQDFDAVFGRFALDRKGLVQARVRVEAKTLFNLRRTDALLHDAGLPEGASIDVREALLVDTWALPGGAAVAGEIAGKSCASDYCRQVARMAFLGAEKLMDPIAPRLSRTLGLPAHSPLAAVVASLPLGGGVLDSSVVLDVARPPGHTPVKKFFTNVYKDRLDPAASPYHQAYARRGASYLACPRPETQEGKCRYSP